MKLFKALNVVQDLARAWHSIGGCYWCRFILTDE